MERVIAMGGLLAAGLVTSACGVHRTQALGLEGPTTSHARVVGTDSGLHRACDRGGVAQRTVVVQGRRVTELADLGCLEHVQGDLIIRNTSVADLSGLDQLVRVDGDLVIRDNAALRSLAGLGQLAHVGGSVRIVADELPDLDGLGLEQVGTLWLTTPGVTDIEGLRGLTRVDDILDLGHTRHLTSLSGLEDLRHVGGDLVIASHHRLDDLSALSDLDAVGGQLVLGSLPQVRDLTGLHRIARTGGLDVTLPPAVSHLGGLAGLERVDGAVYLLAPGAPRAATRMARVQVEGPIDMPTATQVAAVY